MPQICRYSMHVTASGVDQALVCMFSEAPLIPDYRSFKAQIRVWTLTSFQDKCKFMSTTMNTMISCNIITVMAMRFLSSPKNIGIAKI